MTITGSGFTGATGATGVLFVAGSARAPATNVTVASDTQIIANSPVGSGIADVTVTSPNGISATVPADQFTYMLDPAPSVTTTTPDPTVTTTTPAPTTSRCISVMGLRGH